MNFTIHQIVITKEEADTINAMENPHSHPKMKATRFSETAEDAGKNFVAGLYNKVAIINADDLDHVFNISNEPFNRKANEARITRLGQMHSVSVNDILEDENGDMHLVGPIGFLKIRSAETV